MNAKKTLNPSPSKCETPPVSFKVLVPHGSDSRGQAEATQGCIRAEGAEVLASAAKS